MEFEINPHDTASGIELTPLIDVVFQLLVFFMLTANFMLPSLNIQLPIADEASPVEQNQQIIVSLNPAGELFIGEVQVSSDFEPALKHSLIHQDTTTIYLNADAGVKYSEILKLMKRIRNAGASQINFLHEPE